MLQHRIEGKLIAVHAKAGTPPGRSRQSDRDVPFNRERARFRAKQPVPGILDMEYFDASFLPVDEAEISPPSFT